MPARNVSVDYLSRKADNTIRRQATDLVRFVELLNHLGKQPAWSSAQPGRVCSRRWNIPGWSSTGCRSVAWGGLGTGRGISQLDGGSGGRGRQHQHTALDDQGVCQTGDESGCAVTRRSGHEPHRGRLRPKEARRIDERREVRLSSAAAKSPPRSVSRQSRQEAHNAARHAARTP